MGYLDSAGLTRFWAGIKTAIDALITPKGTWNINSVYNKRDIVSTSGNSYIAKQNVPYGTAITNSTYWQLLAEKGDPGTTPVKGTDYWTASDKQDIVDDVLAALPTYNGEVV